MVCLKGMSKTKEIRTFYLLYNLCEFQRFRLLLLESLGNKHSVQNDLGPSQDDFVQVDLSNLCYNPPSKQC